MTVMSHWLFLSLHTFIEMSRSHYVRHLIGYKELEPRLCLLLMQSSLDKPFAFPPPRLADAAVWYWLPSCRGVSFPCVVDLGSGGGGAGAKAGLASGYLALAFTTILGSACCS